MAAMQQLLHLVDSHPGGLKEVDLLSTIGIRQIDLVEEMTNIRSLEASIGGMFHCVDHPRFDNQVGWLFFFRISRIASWLSSVGLLRHDDT